MTRTLATVFVMVAIAIVRARVACADANDDRRALVMLRILAYDKQLAERSGRDPHGADVVRIVIVYPKGDDGTAEATRWTAAFAKARKLKVDGRAVAVDTHLFESAADLDRALTATHPAALVACDGLTRRIGAPELAKLSRAHKVLSLATREPDAQNGLAVAIVAGEQRDEIVVNLRAAAAEGVKFDAGLLQLTRTVGSP